MLLQVVEGTRGRDGGREARRLLGRGGRSGPAAAVRVVSGRPPMVTAALVPDGRRGVVHLSHPGRLMASLVMVVQQQLLLLLLLPAHIAIVRRSLLLAA